MENLWSSPVAGRRRVGPRRGPRRAGPIEARDPFDACRWQRCTERLAAADACQALDGEGLGLLGEAAFFVGAEEESVAAFRSGVSALPRVLIRPGVDIATTGLRDSPRYFPPASACLRDSSDRPGATLDLDCNPWILICGARRSEGRVPSHSLAGVAQW